MSTEPPSQPSPSSEGFNRALTAFLRGFLRLIVVLLLGGLLGLAIFFGLPYLNRQITEPIQRNSTAIAALQADQRRLESEMDRRLEAAQTRLLALEIAQDNLKEQADTLSSQVTTLQDANAELAATLQANNEHISALATQAAAPDPQSTEIARALTRQAAQIDRLQEDLTALETRLDEQDDPVLNELNREIQILKAAQLLTRARLALAFNDVTGARTEINGARAVLAAWLDTAAGDETRGLASVLQRLELALDNLQSAPLLAIEDVELAYQLLLGSSGMAQGTPESGQDAVEEAATEPMPTSSVTPGAARTPTTTPTRTPTITSTPTPGS